MNAIHPRPARRVVVALCLAAGLLTTTANADERRGHDRREPYRSKHWIYDGRHHLDHYYPVPGYAVTALPPDFLALNFGRQRLFFQAGVWYQPRGRAFVVVRPPLGVRLPVLPPAYATVWFAGVPYYYANETYYVSAPGGYAVADPPASSAYIEAPLAAPQPPAPPPAPAAPAAQPAGGTWYYCDAAKAYYPYVGTCPEGWRTVPATAPPR